MEAVNRLLSFHPHVNLREKRRLGLRQAQANKDILSLGARAVYSFSFSARALITKWGRSSDQETHNKV
jgi:hypothetical protein